MLTKERIFYVGSLHVSSHVTLIARKKDAFSSMSMQIIVILLFGVWMFCPILLPLILNRGN